MKPGSPPFYFGVLLIIGLIILINFIIFTVVIYKLTCSKKNVGAHKTTTGRAKNDLTWRRVQNAVAISALLGVTWFFGFMAIGGARVVFNVLFLVFNSLQGLAIFMMFCVRQKEVREKWSEWLPCERKPVINVGGTYKCRDEVGESMTLQEKSASTDTGPSRNLYSTQVTSLSETVSTDTKE